MKNKSVEYFKNGNSCSESIILAAAEAGFCPRELLSCATAFSGGMSSGCLCGAVAAAQMVIGYNFGKENSKHNEILARAKSKELLEKFMKRNKAACCRVLSAGLEGMARKEHCSKMVADSAEILEELVNVSQVNAK